jgi:cyclic pyranopterin phosphate synthase
MIVSTRTASEVRPTAGTASHVPPHDAFGRRIAYLRLSVTDRCDLRCVYCMAEHMTFLPKAEVLSIEELDRLATAFIGMGVRKLRLTGGEPLVRKGIGELVARLSRHLEGGVLDELTLTTNGTRLAPFAEQLAACGMRRINVSLDTLDPDCFARLTRGGDLGKVLRGIDAAQSAGLRVKINTVALARDNRPEIPNLIAWAHARDCDITLIETMPLGAVDEDRADQFVSLAELRRELAERWTLTAENHQTGGPARYFRIQETGGRLGLITPLSHSFCDSCNRVRVTCTGTLHTCLGHEDATELRDLLRGHPDDDAELLAAIRKAVAVKPREHHFRIGPQTAPAVARHMSRTGG